MRIKYLILLLFICIVQNQTITGQNLKLKDSLTARLAKTSEDSTRLKVYKEILESLKRKNYDLGANLVKDALSLSKRLEQTAFVLHFEFLEAKFALTNETKTPEEITSILENLLLKSKEKKLNSLTYLILSALGDIYFQHLNTPEIALQYFLKSSKKFETIENNTELHSPYKALSALYWYHKKDYKKAGYYAEKNLALSKRRGNQNEIGVGYSGLGIIALQLGQNTKSLEYFQQGLDHLDKNKHRDDYAMTLYNMAVVHLRMQDTINAIDTYQKSLQLFRSISMAMRINHTLGVIYLMKKKKDSADFYLKKCFEHYNAKKDYKSLLKLNISIGTAYVNKGQITEALQLYFEALEQAEQSKDIETVSQISNEISIVYKSQKNIKEAINYQNKALQNYITLKDSSNIAKTKNNIGELLYDKKNYQQSLKYGQEALHQFMLYRDSCQISSSYILIGKSHFGRKQLDSARYYLDKGIPLATSCKNPISLCSAYITLGEIYVTKNQDSQAYNSFKKALKFGLQSKNIESIKNSAELLFPFYQKKGQYKKAFETINLYQAAKDSLFNQENTRALVQKELAYAFEKQQQQKDIKQQQAIERQKLITNRIVLVCLSFIALALLYYRNLQIKKKANILLSQQNKEIAKQKTALEELDASKSRLFANISHELRTPLTLISSPVAYLLNDTNNILSKEEQISQLHIVQRNTKQLKGLVNDILDLSKLESNRLKLQEDGVLLNPFLKKVAGNFDSLAQHLKIQYTIKSCINDNISAVIDKDKVEKILNNLLSNAIKHTPSQGIVHLIACIEKDIIRIEVKDTGYGIPEEDIPHIFNRFYQGKNNQDHLQGGTGIGLALAKELALLMNADIEVKSQLGKGSNFVLKLPYIPSKINDQIIIEDTPDNKITLCNKEQEIIPENSQKILIVEDHPDMQRFIKQLLTYKYQIFTANNGIQALELLDNENIDLIISDVMMPEMDGYELLQNLKNHDIHKNKPVIMLTALHGVEHKLEALTIGVDDYLSKPFYPEELKARVDNLLERYEVRKMIAQEIEEEHTFQENINSDSDTDQLLQTDKVWLAEVELIIKNELENETFNISTLADQFFLSSRQFRRKIKKITGLSPKKLQTEIALLEARKLLELKTYQTVKAVAMTVGMSNVWRFTQLYEQRFGKKPSDYF